MNLQSALHSAKIKSFEDEKTYHEMMKEFRRETEILNYNAEKWKSNLRQADKSEYTDWLDGHLRNGGKITHFYDYPFSRHDFYVAMGNITITPLYGSDSLNIIVPEDVECCFEKTGHINIYYVSDFSNIGFFVPAYSDMIC